MGRDPPRAVPDKLVPLGAPVLLEIQGSSNGQGRHSPSQVRTRRLGGAKPRLTWPPRGPSCPRPGLRRLLSRTPSPWHPTPEASALTPHTASSDKRRVTHSQVASPALTPPPGLGVTGVTCCPPGTRSRCRQHLPRGPDPTTSPSLGDAGDNHVGVGGGVSHQVGSPVGQAGSRVQGSRRRLLGGHVSPAATAVGAGAATLGPPGVC